MIQGKFLSAAAPGTAPKVIEVVDGPTNSEIQKEKLNKAMVPILIGVVAIAATFLAIKKFKK